MLNDLIAEIVMFKSTKLLPEANFETLFSSLMKSFCPV